MFSEDFPKGQRENQTFYHHEHLVVFADYIAKNPSLSGKNPKSRIRSHRHPRVLDARRPFAKARTRRSTHPQRAIRVRASPRPKRNQGRRRTFDRDPRRHRPTPCDRDIIPAVPYPAEAPFDRRRLFRQRSLRRVFIVLTGSQFIAFYYRNINTTAITDLRCVSRHCEPTSGSYMAHNGHS